MFYFDHSDIEYYVSCFKCHEKVHDFKYFYN